MLSAEFVYQSIAKADPERSAAARKAWIKRRARQRALAKKKGKPVPKAVPTKAAPKPKKEAPKTHRDRMADRAKSDWEKKSAKEAARKAPPPFKPFKKPEPDLDELYQKANAWKKPVRWK